MKKGLFLVLVALIVLLSGCGYDITSSEDLTNSSSAKIVNRAAVTTANPVQLVQATAYHSSHYGISADEFTIKIRVKNLGYEKKVNVWAKTATGTWTNLRAGYFVQSEENGDQIWTVIGTQASYPYASNLPELAHPYEFAIKYKVNGVTYWDNNNNQNYHLGATDGEMLGNDINVLALYSSGYNNTYNNYSTFYGQVLVKNLAYNKKVKIIYTTDNWATTKVLNCEFVSTHYFPYGSTVIYPNNAGVERWSFNANIPLNTTSVKYAISYEVNGVTYWDNNYGKNYKTIIR